MTWVIYIRHELDGHAQFINLDQTLNEMSQNNVQYIDGFTLPIPRAHLEEYGNVARQVAEIWKEHGALAYFEFVGDDMNLEGTRSFTEVTNARDDEAIIFGYVVFDSRASRDLANQRVINDPRMPALIDPLTQGERLVFDATRMVFGGFKRLV